MAHTSRVPVRGGDVHSMQRAEDFFHALGASIMKREKSSLHAAVSHPDGFDISVLVQYFATGTEEVLVLRRCSGDPTLFGMIGGMLAEIGADQGTTPRCFYDGQMLPRISRTYSPPLADVPYLCLDAGNLKRKLAEM